MRRALLPGDRTPHERFILRRAHQRRSRTSRLGKDHSYSVTFTLDRPIQTGDGLLFSRVTVRYEQSNPYGNATDNWPLAP